MTPPAGGVDAAVRPTGIRASVRRVMAHGSSIVRLERELAQTELERKGMSVGAGAGTAIAAGIVLLYAVGFGLAAVTAALALAVDWWLALLIVFVALLLLVAGLGLAARSLFRRGTPLKPEQAIEEARLTKQALRGNRG